MRFTRSTRARAVVAAGALVLALGIPGGMALASSGSPSTHPAAKASDKIPHYNHIAVIMFTDHGFKNILNNKHAPTFNKLGKEYGLATHYYTTSDPDVAGMMAFLAGNDYKINDGAPYWDMRVSKPSLLSQLGAAHLSWKEYVQDIPYAGYLGNCYPIVCEEWDSLYKQEKFNPVPDLSYVADHPAQAKKMVPASELMTDARDGSLPNFSFIDANECTNMHGGPPWCEDSPNNLYQRNDNFLVRDGDNYLKQVVHAIMSGPQWKQGRNAIVITETEGNSAQGCCDAKPGTGTAFTVVVTNHGPRHLQDGTPFNHYSLLASVEHAFGLGCLQYACDTRHVIPMGRLFGARRDGAYGFPSRDPVKSSPAHAADHTAASTRSGPSTSSSSAGAPGGTWKQVTSADTGTNDNDLWSISGRSPKDIWAAGSLLPTSTATIVQSLVEHYNGKKWSVVPTPDVGTEANFLYGISELKDGTVWTTGTYTRSGGHTDAALTMRWSGHHWKIIPAVSPGYQDNMLYSVAGLKDNDVWAVGTYGDGRGFFHPLIEHWNGTAWTAVSISGLASSARGILTEVSADGHGVWAAGQVSTSRGDRQVLLHLAGNQWVIASGHLVKTAGGRIADAYPMAVEGSAAGPWVAGNDRAGHRGFSNLVESPAGTSGMLRQLTVPDPTAQDNYVQAIAPVNGGKDAWAVGWSASPKTQNASSLIMYGSAAGGWHIVKSPDPSTGNNILDGILAFSSSNIWAVGEFDGNGGMKTFIAHYTG